MTVYCNLGGRTASETLEMYRDDLRTERMLVEYEPETDTSICLENVFDYPTLSVLIGNECVNTVMLTYPGTDIDEKLKQLSLSLFGKSEQRPYEEWLLIRDQRKDEATTKREIMRLLGRCESRSLSDGFKHQMREWLLSIAQ